VRDGTGLLVEVATSLDSSFVGISSSVTGLESSVALNTVGTEAPVGGSSTELNC
jgi:RNase P/RNase MRP subunit p29